MSAWAQLAPTVIATRSYLPHRGFSNFFVPLFSLSGSIGAHAVPLLHWLGYMAVAANENDIEPRKVSFKGAKQAVTAFAPKIEAARPEDRGRLIDAMLTTIAYHRVGDRPGRWEPQVDMGLIQPCLRKMRPQERYVKQTAVERH